MTRRQIQRLQCRLRRGVNELYHGYIAGVLQQLQAQDRTGEIDRALATLPMRNSADQSAACKQPDRSPSTHRQLKLQGDFGCARVRERLWRLQHLPFDLSAAGAR
jgi:hypothetical protein